jgi:hypothetical protein
MLGAPRPAPLAGDQPRRERATSVHGNRCRRYVGFGSIRAVQGLLGHAVSTTMIYTRVPNKGGKAVRGPADNLALAPPPNQADPPNTESHTRHFAVTRWCVGTM